MKKILFLSLMAIVCQMMQAFEVNGISYVIINEEAVVIKPGTESYVTHITYELDEAYRDHISWTNQFYKGDIVIPSKIVYEGKEYPVTGIAQGAFEYARILSLSLPSTIEKIGYAAFYINYLKELILPNSVKKIGELACSEMHELERLVMPSDLDSIPNKFCYSSEHGTVKSKLKELVLPNKLRYIGKNAFLYQNEISNPITLPDCVEHIEPYAFYSANFPTSVPPNLKSLEPYAFYFCKGLKNIKVSGRFKTIPEKCFQGVINCESLEIEEGVENIEKFAFTGIQVTTLLLPSTLKTLNRGSLSIFYSGGNYQSRLTSVYALMKEPCKLENREWGEDPNHNPAYGFYVNTTLYVPIGCAEAYKAAGWGNYFKNIIEMDEDSQKAAYAQSITGVTTIITPTNTNSGYFNLQGQKLDAPQKGINILRTKDGNTKKVYVK